MNDAVRAAYRAYNDATDAAQMAAGRSLHEAYQALQAALKAAAAYVPNNGDLHD
jgi:hypothetical protein